MSLQVPTEPRDPQQCLSQRHAGGVGEESLRQETRPEESPAFEGSGDGQNIRILSGSQSPGSGRIQKLISTRKGHHNLHPRSIRVQNWGFCFLDPPKALGWRAQDKGESKNRGCRILMLRWPFGPLILPCNEVPLLSRTHARGKMKTLPPPTSKSRQGVRLRSRPHRPPNSPQ